MLRRSSAPHFQKRSSTFNCQFRCLTILQWVQNRRDEVKGVLLTPPAMTPQSSLFLILYLLVLRVAARDCTALQSLKLTNATIKNAVHLSPRTTFDASADPTCALPTYNNTVALCRVRGTVNTSSTSSVDFEMWLPDTWYGRVLAVGNGALGGCKHFFYDLSLVCPIRFQLLMCLSFHFQVSITTA